MSEQSTRDSAPEIITVIQQLRTRQLIMIIIYIGFCGFSWLARYLYYGEISLRITLVACVIGFGWAVAGVVLANVVRLQTFKRFWVKGGLNIIGLIIGQKKFWQILTMWTAPGLIGFFLFGDAGYWLVIIVMIGCLMLTQPSKAMVVVMDQQSTELDSLSGQESELGGTVNTQQDNQKR